MKTTELIARLQKLVEEKGDQDVAIRTEEGTFAIGACFYDPFAESIIKPIEPLFIKQSMEEEMKRYARLCDIIMPLHMENILLRDSLKGVCKSMEECRLLMCRIEALRVSGKQRKTTFKTIRRNCAKRNR